jgi:predicted GNAT superfamily acetyltransferase
MASEAALAGMGGVVVRELDRPDEHRLAERLVDRTWEAPPGKALVPAEMMRMLAFTGSYVAGAFRGEDLVGVSVGVLSRHEPGSSRSNCTLTSRA